MKLKKKMKILIKNINRSKNIFIRRNFYLISLIQNKEYKKLMEPLVQPDAHISNSLSQAHLRLQGMFLNPN